MHTEHRYTPHQIHSWPHRSTQTEAFITHTDTNSTKSVILFPSLAICVCVCVFVYIYLCVSMYTYTYVPGGSLQQLSLPSLPWIWPLQLLAPGHNSPQGHSPTPVAGTDHCTHIQKDTHASRYPNRLPDPMIPPAALWDSPGPFDSHLLL